MCGIAGVTSHREQDVRAILDRISHRGPDDRGVLRVPGAYLGHVRLSILDLSSAGHQPMVTADGKISIVFNGEIFNYHELRKELETRGHRFSSNSDTEALLYGYVEYGLDIFSRVRGMWAAAIHDATRGTITLARDPFGIKPLYYAVRDSELFFSSELKGLRAVLPNLEPNTEAYPHFLALGYFIGPSTCYRGIEKLRPGSVITWNVDARRFEDERRIDFFPQESRPGREKQTFSEATDIFESSLAESVQAHFLSDVPVGILFSGGNDSSLIAALAKRLGQTPACYHVSISGRNDTSYARQIAEHLNLPLRVVELDETKFAEQYDRLWQIVDEPTADVSVLPTSLIYGALRGEGIKVVLSGEGGDEFFGGYLRHRQLAGQSALRDHDSLVDGLNAVLAHSPSQFIFPVASIIQRVRQLGVDVLRRNDVLTTYLALVKTAALPYWEKAARTELLETIRTSGAEHWLPARLLPDLYGYLPNDLMYKNDISSMASSVEARVPFLDRNVFQTVVRDIKPEFLLSAEAKDKRLIKAVLSKYLPEAMVYRPKTGFGFSFQRYALPQFQDDVRKAQQFHLAHAASFGIPRAARGVFNPVHASTLIRKYPRFAFGLVTSWKAFEG